MGRATRTVIVKSVPIPRRTFRVFIELEGMYRNMVEQLTMFAVREGITSFTKLKALKYRELRNLYPQLPSHFAHTSCQDASTRAKSFLKLRWKGVAKREYPEIRKISIWLDDHLWKMEGLTAIRIATHKGWIKVGLEPHNQYWKYVNTGWRLASEAKIKLDRKECRLIILLTFYKDVEVYEPRGYIAVDVNENNIAFLVDGGAYLLETNMKKVVLGYHYRRKRVQEKYDKPYGVKCRIKKKVLRKLKEKKVKNDVRWKIANIIVREALKRGYGIVLEKLGKNPTKRMLKDIKDDQLRHRIYQASFKGIQKAIEEKAKECGVATIYVDPRKTSRVCPIHRAEIRYDNGSRIGRCSKGGELWHRDVLACRNLLLKALRGDGSNAPSPAGLIVDGSPVPLGSTATHDPTQIAREAWARWKSLDATINT